MGVVVKNPLFLAVMAASESAIRSFLLSEGLGGLSDLLEGHQQTLGVAEALAILSRAWTRGLRGSMLDLQCFHEPGGLRDLRLLVGSQAATSWWSALLPLTCQCGLCLGVWSVLSAVMVCVLLRPLVLHTL